MVEEMVVTEEAEEVLAENTKSHNFETLKPFGAFLFAVERFFWYSF